MVYELKVERRQAGQPVKNYKLFETAWHTCTELQQTEKYTWTSRTLLALQSLDRWEIAVWYNGEAVGGLILGHEDWDAHVGECLTVYAQFVQPEHRNNLISFKCMRAAVALAKDLGYKTVAYTHRLAPWRYLTIYKDIKYEKS